VTTGTITERRSAAEGKCQHNSDKAEDEQADIDDADDLPAAEPNLTAPTKGLQSRPEAMGQVEP